ncbi:MAG: V-type ATP synthase subunit E family protein [Clostridiales bacterium]|nr:V-type ATP synthase subunit E family protein [Clostridiales bacterium]MDY6117526.1 V-type ATP synthase subunit E family protein [Anaerovoracaceae bacterium]
MSVEKITSKILEDAKAQADAITLDANLRAEGIVNEAKENAESLFESYKTRGEEEKLKLIDRKKSVAEIDGRKITLGVKQEIIDKAFKIAAEKIASMENDKYIDFLVEKIKASGIREGEIVMNPTQREEIGTKLVEKLNQNLAFDAEFKGFTLSDETVDAVGGFMVKKGQIYMNGTLENLIEEEYGNIVSSVVEKLF